MQVCLQRLKKTGTVNQYHLISALLRHQLPHIHPASPVTYNYYTNVIPVNSYQLLNLQNLIFWKQWR